MPPLRAAAYITASFLLAMTQGLGMNMLSANIPQIQGSLGATNMEATWLVAAYMAPNVSMSLALIRIRNQYGLRNFAELSILGFVLVCGLHFFVSDLNSAIIVRFFSGVAASPMSSLAFLYMLEPFAPAKKLNFGLCLSLTNTAIGAPLARLVSPGLLDIGLWHGLFTFELSFALMAFGAIYLLPLTPQPRAKVITKLDIVSYLFIAFGFGSAAVVLVMGRLYWWTEAPWLGMLLAFSIVCLTIAAVIELNRQTPLIDIRWLASPEIVHFTAALLTFRMVLSEQSSVSTGLFQALGLQNQQMAMLYWIIIGSSVVAGFACALVLKPGREPAIHAVALGLLMVGAYMDSHSTNLTRPAQMYLSQAMIAMAGALFLPTAMAAGLTNAFKKGPNYILSFIIVFLTTQSIGGLLGSAVFTSFVTLREKYHSNILVERINLGDPLVAQRVAQLAGAYGKVLTDKTLLNAEGLALLNQQATREANVLAYNDAFLMISIISFIALVALLIHMAAIHLAPAFTARAQEAPQAA
ncbi:MFS family permease [Mesorhizobium soli]|uniref:MFS transporter n=1 Tax=Pseudaminobacter soli (ex Li et al. 2025) TaxID=1295366 RepID=UPI00247303E6|nr:MFS transporter [Mesorhizobium soli]MDH6231179.1 MFS family permease [Mesorhizobium soli]